MRPMRELGRELRDEWRAGGLTGLLRRRGWRAVAVAAAVYLVRDLVLYVALPALVWFVTRP